MLTWTPLPRRREVAARAPASRRSCDGGGTQTSVNAITRQAAGQPSIGSLNGMSKPSGKPPSNRRSTRRAIRASRCATRTRNLPGKRRTICRVIRASRPASHRASHASPPVKEMQVYPTTASTLISNGSPQRIENLTRTTRIARNKIGGTDRVRSHGELIPEVARRRRRGKRGCGSEGHGGEQLQAAVMEVGMEGVSSGTIGGSKLVNDIRKTFGSGMARQQKRFRPSTPF